MYVYIYTIHHSYGSYKPSLHVSWFLHVSRPFQRSPTTNGGRSPRVAARCMLRGCSPCATADGESLVRNSLLLNMAIEIVDLAILNLVGGLDFFLYVRIYWEESSQLTFIFLKPPTRIVDLAMLNGGSVHSYVSDC